MAEGSEGSGSLPTVQAHQRIGTVLRRRWTLERVIGVGGTATVYAATHRNGSRVAIKVFHPWLRWDPAIRRRMLREGYLANSIGVHEVVKVIDDDIEGDIAYLVMELLEGDSLEALRQGAGGRLPAVDVVEIGCRLLAVLEAAHSSGVLHRDIKPANLFRTINPMGFKLLDFGIAKNMGPEALTERSVPGSGVTGTPVFMAPELAHGCRDRMDVRTEVWAAGATLFTLLTGEHVYSGSTVTDILRAAGEQEPPNVRARLGNAPAELAVALERALALEPAARYPSASEMRLAFEECRFSLRVLGERSRFFESRGQWGSWLPAPALDEGVSAVVPSVAGRAVMHGECAAPHAGFWHGRIGRLWWFQYSGPCTDETWTRYLAMVEQMLDTGQNSLLACFAFRADAPSPVQRKQLADFVERNREALKRLVRFALVVDSVVHRLAITAVSWLVKKPFDERIFASPFPAIKWLTEMHSGLDPEAVRASIAAHVPRHSLWPALENRAAETVQSYPQSSKP